MKINRRVASIGQTHLLDKKGGRAALYEIIDRDDGSGQQDGGHIFFRLTKIKNWRGFEVEMKQRV